MTKSEAYKLVSFLQGAYPNRSLPESTAEVYAMALADLDFREAQAAVTRLIQTSRFLPTIAEIRERVVESRVSLPSPEVAWGEVRGAISSVGAYRSPVFECEEIDRAVGIIGWRNICLDENTAATRARFIDAYKSLRAERVELEATGQYVPPERRLPERQEPAGFLPDGEEEFVPSSFKRALPRLKALKGGAE